MWREIERERSEREGKRDPTGPQSNSFKIHSLLDKNVIQDEGYFPYVGQKKPPKKHQTVPVLLFFLVTHQH